MCAHRHLLKHLFISSQHRRNDHQLLQSSDKRSLPPSLHPSFRLRTSAMERAASGHAGSRGFPERAPSKGSRLQTCKTHTCFCITSLQQMQPQPRLRHHKNDCGSRNQLLPNPTLLRQLRWKPEKNNVLDNIKMLKCKARLYHPAGSSPPCRKCY